MTAIHFDRFTLDPVNRLLVRDGEPVDLPARYLDALMVLAAEPGALVTKQRFHEEVWRGVPVTDEALTQCIKTLRRALGDDAGDPRFIETVPKHGYRFVAALKASENALPTRSPTSRRWLLTGAGTLGGALAGAIGGLAYGFVASAQPGPGAASALIVVLCITVLIATVGAAGVSLGIALAGRHWTIAGGALGGLAIGAAVKLIGLDAFMLLFGRAPLGMTGASEGALLGATVGLGVLLATRTRSRRLGLVYASIAGAVAGIAISLLGGRLMGGSLALLAETFPGRIRLDAIGALVGESGFGPTARAVTAALEGALFAAAIAAAMLLAERATVDPAASRR